MAGKKQIKHTLHKIAGWAVHLLYPYRCPFCDCVIYRTVWETQYPICVKCKDSLEYLKEPICKKCGKPVINERTEYCGDCSRHEHRYTQGKALWLHKGSVKDSIYRFKYSNRLEYGKFYGQEIASQYGDWIKKCGIEGIIPIPLHKKKKRQRGYNQAKIIAMEIGRQLNIPVYDKILIRTINTRPQKELNDRERKNNLKKAFKILENNVQLSHILLVDDIYTTGSTMDSASFALTDAGVKKIFFICVSIGRGN